MQWQSRFDVDDKYRSEDKRAPEHHRRTSHGNHNEIGAGSDIGNRYRITLLSDRTLRAGVIYETRNAARTRIQRSEKWGIEGEPR